MQPSDKCQECPETACQYVDKGNNKDQCLGIAVHVVSSSMGSMAAGLRPGTYIGASKLKEALPPYSASRILGILAY
jgi:hypothetical protein